MIITGTSSSRLSELRKYTVTNDFTKQYVIGGSINTDGIDLSSSNPLDKIVYYIGGIKYVDIITGSTSGTTLNIYTPQDETVNLNRFKFPMSARS